MLSLLKSSKAITCACISFTLTTSITLNNLIHNPIPIFIWIVCGGIAGRLINKITPREMRPYIACGIYSLSLIRVGSRILGYEPLEQTDTWIKLTIDTSSHHLLYVTNTTNTTH